MNRLKLLNALNMVKAGLAKKDVVEQSTDFIFTKGMISSSGEEISISYKFDDVDFECVVPSNTLLALLNKAKDEELDISIDEGEQQLNVKGKKFKASLKIQSDIKININSGKDLEFFEIPSNFKEAVRLACLSTHKNTNQNVLFCVHIFGDTVHGCDGFRFTEAKFSSPFKSEILLPSSAALEVCKHDIVSYAGGAGWFHFKLKNNCVISCRLASGKYPDVSGIVSGGEYHSIRLPKDMGEIIDRAITMISDKSNASINVKVDGSEMTISSSGDFGRFEETARTKSDKENFAFQANPDFIKSVLADGVSVELSSNRAKFSGDNFFHIIALQA